MDQSPSWGTNIHSASEQIGSVYFFRKSDIIFSTRAINHIKDTCDVLARSWQALLLYLLVWNAYTHNRLVRNWLSIQVMVFWVVMLCCVVVGYQRFGGPCCLHLQGEGPSKRWCPTTTLHGVTTSKLRLESSSPRKPQMSYSLGTSTHLKQRENIDRTFTNHGRLIKNN
jgi:hypothetical protein